MAGTTSPCAVSVLIAATLGRVSSRGAGTGWNGAYILVMEAILSLSVIALAMLL